DVYAAAAGGCALYFAGVGVVNKPIAVELAAALLHDHRVAGQDHGVFGNPIVDGRCLSVHQRAAVLGLLEVGGAAGQHHALPLAVVIGVGVAGGLRAIRMERALIHGHAAGEDDLAAVLAAGERMGVDVDRLILVRL